MCDECTWHHTAAVLTLSNKGVLFVLTFGNTVVLFILIVGIKVVELVKT